MKKLALSLVCLLFLGGGAIVTPSVITYKKDYSNARAFTAADSLMTSMEDLQRASEKLERIADR